MGNPHTGRNSRRRLTMRAIAAWLRIRLSGARDNARISSANHPLARFPYRKSNPGILIGGGAALDAFSGPLALPRQFVQASTAAGSVRLTGASAMRFCKPSPKRQPDQAASFSHKAEALRDSASVASRIRFPTGTALVSMLRLFARRLFARSGHRPLHHSQRPGSRLLVQACAGKPGCATHAETVSCRRFVINLRGTRGF